MSYAYRRPGTSVVLHLDTAVYTRDLKFRHPLDRQEDKVKVEERMDDRTSWFIMVVINETDGGNVSYIWSVQWGNGMT